MRITVSGREHMAPGQTYVIMSNHQSLYDVPVLFYALGSNLRMVAKAELLRLPVFGPALREAGFIMIDRKDRAQAVTSLQGATTQLAQGTHVWISPEGTRSDTGALAPFKKGGFMLAMDAGLPILPVTLHGTRDALLSHSLLTRHDAAIRVTIHPAVACPPAAKAPAEQRASRDALMATVRGAIAQGLHQ
jgi:1-acyl-sn-glycerol-3-phosphate acyltransferase